MPDYTAYIGGSTTLMIRDTGGWVEFWIQTGSSTWNNDQQYSYGANDAGSGVREFAMVRGGNWQYVDHVYVTYDQDISFTIYGSGLGFPTYSFFQHIQRTTVPEPPTLRGVDAISDTEIHIYFTGNYDGGTPVEEWEIGYGSSPNGPTSTVGSDGETDVDGFHSGQHVYFWARGRNALGWSGWSNRGEATTWQTPAAPGGPTYYNVAQTSVGVNFAFSRRSNDPPNLEKQLRYGTDPTGAVIIGTITVDESTEYVYNLIPGGTYYFSGRARNSVGWGPWSTPSKLILIAGAVVLVSGVWTRAVPYVNVGGVWKVAEPWVKDQGVWKKTAI